jgi:hypothetical protein
MSQGTIDTQGSPADGQGKGEKPETGPLVHITVNNVQYEIHRGRQTVAAIKTAGKVPLADDLEQVIDNKLVPLADDGAVTIKGGEVFVSHPKDSGSSSD